MAITDLTGAKLKFLDVVNLENGTWQINFKSNNQNFTTFKVEEPYVETGYLTFSSEEPFSVTVTTDAGYDGSLEYSTDTISWTEVTKGTAISSINNKIYLRGSGNTYCKGCESSSANKPVFSLSGSNIKCEGNIETLLDFQKVLNGEHPVMADRCYQYMFYDCASLITAPTLPATTLAIYCYDGMFYRCTSLTQAPELPATTLARACYVNMFRNCTSLTQTPALPATTLADSCYEGMFEACTRLATLPALPATMIVSGHCYIYMFYGCSLIKLSTTQSDEYPNEYRIPYGSATGVAENEPFDGMFSSTGGTFKSTPEINTIYYTSNEIIQ